MITFAVILLLRSLLSSYIDRIGSISKVIRCFCLKCNQISKYKVIYVYDTHIVEII